MAGALARVSSAWKSVIKAVEGAFRPGPYHLPVTGGWLPDGASQNWWQEGYNPLYSSAYSAMVEACVSAYSQTVAMCPGDHWRLNTKGGRDRVKTSALSRILRYPNAYQTISDFLLNTVRDLYLYGNSYAVGLRNDRFEIDELHSMNASMSFPRLSETGEIFYFLGGNDVMAKKLGEQYFLVPQRDVLHIRLHYLRQYPCPLVGVSPVVAAYGQIGMAEAILKQQAAFYANEARPSAVLSTDLVLDKDSVQSLRDRWNEQVKGAFQGGTPILTGGLKVQPWAVAGKDAATADMLKLSNEQIALAFRVPLQILGLGGSSYGSAEMLMQSWIASGLGFCLNHIEEAFGVLFQLKGQPDEYVEFDTAALLRSALKDRIDALARGVQGGIYSPNEARNAEGMSDVKFGDEPRVQQQVVPLSAAGAIPAAPSAPPAGKPPGAPGPSDGKPPAPTDGGGDKPPPSKPPPDKVYIDVDTQREVRHLLRLTESVGRRRRYAARCLEDHTGGDA